MNTGSAGYLIKQGVVNAWVNRVMTLASIGILTACLIILGGAGLLSLNVRDLFTALENQNEVVVFVADDATAEQITELGDAINKLNNVGSVRYVSKQEALDESKQSMGDQAYLLDGLENDNPYPASYRIVLTDITGIKEFEASLNGLPYIDSVQAPTYLAETLSGIERTLIVLGAVIIGILLVASLVVISNTIKLTVFARRREINIMKYVGATNAFIRLPFVVEGMTIGLVSAVISFFVLFGVYSSLSGMLTDSIVPWVSAMSGNLVPFADVWYLLAAGFLVAGLLIGGMGSASAIRKHLKV